MVFVAGIAATKIEFPAPSMIESNLDRFLNEAEECIRQAAIAIDPLDKQAWLELAEDWMQLARATKELDI